MRVRNAALTQDTVVHDTEWSCCKRLAPGFDGSVPWPCPFGDHTCLSYGNASVHVVTYHLKPAIAREMRGDIVHSATRKESE